MTDGTKETKGAASKTVAVFQVKRGYWRQKIAIPGVEN